MKTLLERFEAWTTDEGMVAVAVIAIVAAALAALVRKFREMARAPRRWCFWHGEWFGEGDCPDCEGRE